MTFFFSPCRGRLGCPLVAAALFLQVVGLLGEPCGDANPPRSNLWWLTLRVVASSPVAVSSIPPSAVGGIQPLEFASGSEFNVTLRSYDSSDTAVRIIHSAKIYLGAVGSAGGKITLIGDFPVSATAGQLIGVGHQYYNTVEVVGYGNDVGDICVNGELTGVLLASTTPLPTQTAAPTNKACVSRVNAPCGSGCCRGLVCSEVEVDGGGGTVGTCVIDTRPVESPPSPPPPSTTPTDGINEEGKNTAPSTWRSSTTGVNTIVASVVGFALIILGIAVVVMVIRRHQRGLYRGVDLDRGTDYSSELAASHMRSDGQPYNHSQCDTMSDDGAASSRTVSRRPSLVSNGSLHLPESRPNEHLVRQLVDSLGGAHGSQHAPSHAHSSPRHSIHAVVTTSIPQPVCHQHNTTAPTSGGDSRRGSNSIREDSYLTIGEPSRMQCQRSTASSAHSSSSGGSVWVQMKTTNGILRNPRRKHSTEFESPT